MAQRVGGCIVDSQAMKHPTSTSILLCAATLVWMGCSGTVSESRPADERGSPTMTRSETTSSARAIPRLDADAPVAFQTATFALG